MTPVEPPDRNVSPSSASRPREGRYPAVTEWPRGTIDKVRTGAVLLKIFLASTLIGLIIDLTETALVDHAPDAFEKLESTLNMTSWGVSCIVAVAVGLGSWRIATPLRDGPPTGLDRPRVAARVVGLLSASTLLAPIALMLVVLTGLVSHTTLLVIGVGSMLAVFAVEATLYGVLAWHLSHVAAAVGNPGAERFASILIWLGPVLVTVGVLIAGLGPFVAVILMYHLLTRLRKQLIAMPG